MYPSHRELIKADLPPYEHPPAWIPSHQRENNPTYESNIHQFLPRTVFLKRSKASDQLGFNVRGGKEFHCGVFISKVVPGSGLEKLGLRQGDQIMSVNDQSFENIAHSEAVRILKMNTNIEMIVRYFPYAYQRTYDKTRFLQSLQQKQQQQKMMSQD